MPAVGQVATYSIERNSGQPGAADFHPNNVTDSASAATAWASGVKTYNAALGVAGKGNIVPTMMEMAHEAGYVTVNVSTAEITDAILGSGLARFDAADEDALEAQGYDVLGSPATQTVATKTDLAGASGNEVFGLFNKGNLTIEKSIALSSRHRAPRASTCRSRAP